MFSSGTIHLEICNERLPCICMLVTVDHDSKLPSLETRTQYIHTYIHTPTGKLSREHIIRNILIYYCTWFDATKKEWRGDVKKNGRGAWNSDVTG